MISLPSVQVEKLYNGSKFVLTIVISVMLFLMLYTTVVRSGCAQNVKTQKTCGERVCYVFTGNVVKFQFSHPPVFYKNYRYSDNVLNKQ